MLANGIAGNDEAVTAKERNLLFPVFLKLEQMKVLLVGGGLVALEKLTAVVTNSPGTKVLVVAKEIHPEFALTAGYYPNVQVITGPYEPAYIDGVDIVICAVNDVPLSGAIRNDAKERGKLINVADKPALCDFYLGSIVTKGNLKVAISTNGKSPTLAKRLREVFSELLPGEMDEVMQNLQEIREQLQGDFQHKVAELNRITKVLVEKPAPRDAEDYWFL